MKLSLHLHPSLGFASLGCVMATRVLLASHQNQRGMVQWLARVLWEHVIPVRIWVPRIQNGRDLVRVQISSPPEAGEDEEEIYLFDPRLSDHFNKINGSLKIEYLIII